MSRKNTNPTSENIQNRSPRYVLQVKDKKILRYAPYPRGNRTFFTEVLNLSETGMAFTVPFLDSPQVGEMMMVEFSTPSSSNFACFAKVQRVQKLTILESDFFQKECKLVAVKFEQLKNEQLLLLRKSLNKEFKKIQTHFYRQQMWLKMLWYWKFKKTLILSCAAASLASFAIALFFI